MPHLVMLYTPQLDAEADLSRLCRKLADAMLSVRDEQGAQVFPTGGTRVLACPAAHHAVGETLAAVVREQLAPLLAARPVGLTLQIDEGHEVFDAKLGNLHALFAKKP
jgi:5-carboxymethyl-2-hydroxymuconate isomerase